MLLSDYKRERSIKWWWGEGGIAWVHLPTAAGTSRTLCCTGSRVHGLSSRTATSGAVAGSCIGKIGLDEIS